MPNIIKKKRDGDRLEEEEIRSVVKHYCQDEIPDYQMAAFLMAAFLKGLDQQELHALTDEMIRSGERLKLADIPSPKVDKHSTGGVGDKISIALAPAVATLGVAVPMIAGRGLGHTGGTLDKLESIPGFDVNITTTRARKILEHHGAFIIGQTVDLVPADRKLYALRDVTGTVESIPLIASSIMSKKIAEDIDALVLDVKVGSGAFMKNVEDGRELARTLISIGEDAGKKVRALITDMSCPIGSAVGNALEVAEAISVLRGEGPLDTMTLTIELGAEMLVLAGVFSTLESARESMNEVLKDGRALAKFSDMIEAQGGDPGICDNLQKLPAASGTVHIPAIEDGYVACISPMETAMAALELGAGRRIKEDAVDPATGVSLLVQVGDWVETGEPLAILHHNDRGIEEAVGRMARAFEVSKEPASKAPLIIERM